MTSDRFRAAVARAMPKGRLAQSVTVLAGGAALGQALTVLVSPILTRLYLPDDFGVFGVYASMLGIVTAISSLRYEYAIPLPDDDETAANILALCFVALLGTATIAWFALHSLGMPIAAWTNVPGLGRYLWLIPLGVLGAGAYKILSYWAVRKKDFARISKTKVTRGFARASIQVGLGWLVAGPLGLILGQMAGETAGSAALGLGAWNKDRASFKQIGLVGIFKAATRYKRFLLFSSWADLFEALGLNIPQLLLAAFYGAQVAGWFALGQRVIAVPLNIVVESVSQVYFGEAARLPKDDPWAMRQLFLKLTGRLALIGSLPVTVICVLAPWLFTFIFGPEWSAAGQYVQFLGLAFAARFATVPFLHTLNVLERQDLYAIWEVTRLILVVSALVASRAWEIDHIHAIAIYSLSMLIAYAILWGVVWGALHRTSGSISRDKAQVSS